MIQKRIRICYNFLYLMNIYSWFLSRISNYYVNNIFLTVVVKIIPPSFLQYRTTQSMTNFVFSKIMISKGWQPKEIVINQIVKVKLEYRTLSIEICYITSNAFKEQESTDIRGHKNLKKIIRNVICINKRNLRSFA